MSKPRTASTFLDKLSDLTKIADNASVLTALLAQATAPLGVVPFVGAGLSAQFEFKTWTQFLLDQAEHTAIKEGIKARISNGEYEEAASDLHRERLDQAFYRAIHTEYGDAAERQVSGGAVSFLPLVAKGFVVTTNFDRVLEKTFAQAGRSFERIVLGARGGLVKEALGKDKRVLLKIHGDAEDEADLVFTAEGYARDYEKVGTLPKVIENIFTSRPCLFLGCSLNRDRLVKILARAECAHQGHFAIVELPNRDILSDRLRYFSEHHISPIFYPSGQHGSVESILKALSEELPSPVSREKPKWHEIESIIPDIEGESRKRYPYLIALRAGLTICLLALVAGLILAVRALVTNSGDPLSFTLLFATFPLGLCFYFANKEAGCNEALGFLKVATRRRNAKRARQENNRLVCFKFYQGMIDDVL